MKVITMLPHQNLIRELINRESDSDRLSFLLNNYKIKLEHIDNDLCLNNKYLNLGGKKSKLIKLKLEANSSEIDLAIKSCTRMELRFIALNKNLNQAQTRQIINKASRLKESAVIIALIKNESTDLYQILEDESIYSYVSTRKTQPYTLALIERMHKEELNQLKLIYSTQNANLKKILANVTEKVFQKSVIGKERVQLEKLDYIASLLQISRSIAPIESSQALYKMLSRPEFIAHYPKYLASTLGVRIDTQVLNFIAEIHQSCNPVHHLKLLHYVDIKERKYLLDAKLFANLIKKYEEKDLQSVIDFLKIESDLNDELIFHSQLLREKLAQNLDLIAKTPILTTLLNYLEYQPQLLENLKCHPNLDEVLTGMQALTLLNYEKNINSKLYYEKIISIALIDPITRRRAYEILLTMSKKFDEKNVKKILLEKKVLSSSIFNEILYDSYTPEYLSSLQRYISLNQTDISQLSSQATRNFAKIIVEENLSIDGYEILLKLLPTWEDSLDELIKVSKKI